MKKPLLKNILPHIIAIVVFLVVSVIFCKPILDGEVLNQHDNVSWKGMAQNSFEYKEKNGHFPLWNPNLFSGMPNYQVAMEGKSIMPDLTKIFALGMPKPINFFLLACICFYILCLVLKIRPVIGILASLAYSFSTYTPVLIAAGHDTQVLATAYIPLLLAGLISIYDKKYWLGFALTTYAAYQQIAFNHLQVSYYMFLIAAIITIVYLVKWIKEKEWKHMGIAAALAVGAGLIGLAGNALTLKTTAEYAKYTMRGGKDITIDEAGVVKEAKTKGLDPSYAFDYSLGQAETVTFIMPNAFGGYSSKRLKEGSHTAKKLIANRIPEGDAEQIAQTQLSGYWGKLSTQGPAYLGVIICVLGIIGFVLLKTPLRWALLAATVLGILMSWGKYFPAFNTFLFEHLPLYNKFRSPPFAQVIPQFTMIVSAALVLQQLLFGGPLQKTDWKKILYTVGGLFALLGIMYLAMSYGDQYDKELAKNISAQGNEELGRAVIAGLKADRKAMFGQELLRAFGIALLGVGVLFAFYKNWIKGFVAAILLLVISTLDITVMSHSYFTNEKEPYLSRTDDQKLFIPGDDYDNSNFGKTAIDNQLLADKDPDFRVFNMLGTANGSPFSESRTSYYHKSVGGYHAAKLRIYQDIIEKYLMSGQPNREVLNMLNTKYVVTQGQNGQPAVLTNPEAYGSCWLVKHVKVVDSRINAIQDIGTTNLKDTAIVDKAFSKDIVQPQWDSASSIKLTKFDNDVIEYEANANGAQFAVFSEIYYPAGWNAYIDDKPVAYVNANYVLRGLSIPTGKHAIKFVFEPKSVKSGTSTMFIASILILLIFLGGLFMHFRKEMQAKKDIGAKGYPPGVA